MFDSIKRYYDLELWSLQRVWNVVGKALTEEEFVEITGKEYNASGS